MGITVLLSYVLIALFFGACGLTLGYWIFRPSQASTTEGDPDRDAAKEALRRIQRIAETMAGNLQNHQSAVSDADGKLRKIDVERDGVDAVVAIVEELVEHNARIQEQLAEAQVKVDTLAREIACQHQEARTDALTGCANRRAFDETSQFLHEDMARGGAPYALIMLDVDHFKKVNDTYGHAVGDEVLRTIGRVLRNHVRGTDTVARYGGEEFAVLVPDVSITQACFMAESLRMAIAAQLIAYEGGALKVTASFGVALSDPEEMADGLKERSDAALYAAKKSGRNCVYWHDGNSCLPIDGMQLGEATPSTGQNDGAESAPPSVRLSDADDMPITVAGTSLDPDQFDRELLYNLPTKTELCQNVRRRISEWQRGGPTICVTLIELANREKIEGRYGAPAVRALLGAAANVVRQTIRDMDSLARYTPTSLAILMPNTRQKDAVFIMERIRKALQETEVRLQGERLPLEVHIAAAEVTDGDDMQKLLSRASERLAESRQGVIATRGAGA